LETGAGPTSAVSATSVQPYLGRGTSGTLPWCPLDSTKTFANSYTLATPSVLPVCQKQPTGSPVGSYVHAMPTGS